MSHNPYAADYPDRDYEQREDPEDSMIRMVQQFFQISDTFGGLLSHYRL